MHPLALHSSSTALIVCTLIYWTFSMLWFSVLMGKSWSIEIEKIGIKIQKPSKKGMVVKSILTLVIDFVIVLGISFFVQALHIKTLGSAVALGLTLGICFAATSKAIAYVWESKSLRLTLIETGAPVIAMTLASIALMYFR